MMCSKILRKKPKDSAFARKMNQAFDNLSNSYERSVTFILQQKWLAPTILVAALGLGYFLVQNIEQEYAPNQDQGSMMLRIQVAEGSSLESMEAVVNKVHEPLEKYIDEGLIQRTIMFAPGFGGQTNSAVGFVNLVPASERSMSTNELIDELMPVWGQLVDAQVFAFAPSGLSRGGGGQPVEFVLQGSNYDELSLWRDQLMNAASDSGMFTRMDSDLDETQQQVQITVDKNRAAELGVSVTAIGTTLQALLSERNVSTYVRDGEEYDVVMQARDDQRATTEDLQNLYVRSNRSGELIPLSNLISVQNVAGIAQLNRYNRLRAVTISGSLAPNVALGEALTFLENYVDQNLPDHAQYDYRGESLEYKEASGSMFFTFGVAMLILFLVMAAQFESFVHPFVIMFTV
ncbi:MAG: efflux RND transporter permease subunit, partial [Pseudohongiellaceae bacterium]